MEPEAVLQYRACFDRSPLPTEIFRVEREGKGACVRSVRIYANAAFVRLRGKQLSAQGEYIPSMLTTAEQRNAWLELMEQAAFEGRSCVRVKRDHRANTVLRAQIYPLAQGLCACVLQDETAAYELEQRLLEEKQARETLISNTPGGVICLECKEGKTTATYVSAEFCRLLGYSAKEILGKTLQELNEWLHPADRERIEQAEQTTLQTGKLFDQEHRVRCKNGSYLWLIMRGALFPQWDGHVFYGSYTDISARKRLEENLRAEQQKLSAVLETARITIWECNFKKRTATFFRMHNGGDKNLTLHNVPESVLEREELEPDSLPVLRALYETLAQGKPGGTCELHLRAGRQNMRWARIVCLPERVQPDVAVGFFSDVTQEHENSLARAQRELAFTVSSLAFWIIDLKTLCFLSANDVAQKRGVQVGMACTDFFCGKNAMPDTRTAGARVMRALEKKKNCRVAELHRCKENGGIEWMRVSNEIITDGGGEPAVAVGIGEDISDRRAERRRFEEELRYQQAVLGSELMSKMRVNLTRNAVETFYESDENGALRIGMSLQEAADVISAGAAYPQDRKKLRELLDLNNLQRQLQEGVPKAACEYQRLLADGRTIWVRFTAKTYQDPDTGEFKSFFYIYDINEKRTLGLLVERIVDMRYELLGMLDVRTGYLHCYRHSALEEALHYGADMDFNALMPAIIERYVPKELRAEMREAFSLSAICSALETEDCYTRVFPAEWEGSPVRKQWEFAYLNKNKAQIVCTRADISTAFEQQEAQRATLRRALTAAQRANEAKSEFLARMSHEMRTPMNAIMGLTALALDENGNAAAMHEALEKIQTSSQLLLQQINDVLDMNKVESAKIELHPEPYSQDEFCEQMELLVRPMCESKNITFVLDRSRAQPIWALADKIRYRQIFINLLSNAVKYTPAGGSVTFALEHVPQKDGGILGRYRIIDTGVGMSAEFQRHMFEPFARERTENTAGIEGTGLGLAIVKNLIDLLHGSIEVQSTLGVGTTFQVEIPFVLCEAPTEEQQHPAPAPCHLLHEKRVLLVEDNRINTAIAKALLEKKGIRVECAENGQIGVYMFAASPQGRYDAVLMDVMMPVMNGLEAAKAIRTLHRKDAKTVPIIAMTANAFDDDVRHSQEAGMNAHLTKPVEPEVLYETLNRLITHANP